MAKINRQAEYNTELLGLMTDLVREELQEKTGAGGQLPGEVIPLHLVNNGRLTCSSERNLKIVGVSSCTFKCCDIVGA